MPSNVTLNSGTGGATAATAQITHDGDTAQLQLVALMGVSGSEDSYTAGKINGDTTNGLDVDVTRVIPGTSATALGKAEDSAHASTDVGVMMLAVRSDTAASLAGTTGDYQPPITDSSGRLWVNASGAAVPVTDNSGSLTVDDGGSTLSIDDGGASITVDGTVGVSGTVTVDSELTTADLDTGAGTDTRAVVGLVYGASGGGVLVSTTNPLPIGDNGGSLTVDGTVAATQSGTWSARITDGTDTADVLDLTNSNPLTVAIVDGDGTQITSFGGGTQYTEGGTDASITGTAILWEDTSDTLRPVSAAKPLPVEIVAGAGSGGTAAADDADFTAGTTSGTPVMGAYQSTPTAVTDGDMGIIGITANREVKVSVTSGGVAGATHDSAAASEGVQTMLEARSSDGTAVASGDAVRALASLLGKSVSLPYALPGATWSYAAASGGITNTTGVTAKAAAGAGVRNYVTSAQVINGAASVDTDVQIRDGASGTVLWRGFAKAAGGGISVRFDPPLRGSANTLIEVACGTTSSATYVNLQGFTAAE